MKKIDSNTLMVGDEFLMIGDKTKRIALILDTPDGKKIYYENLVGKLCEMTAKQVLVADMRAASTQRPGTKVIYNGELCEVRNVSAPVFDDCMNGVVVLDPVNVRRSLVVVGFDTRVEFVYEDE